AGGNHVTTDSSSVVTASIQTGTGSAGAVLSGTVAVTAVSGNVTFTDLAIDKAGSGYMLLFSTASIGTATSQALDIAVGVAVRVAIVSQPGGAVATMPFSAQPVVSIVDAGGNIV